MKNKVKKGYMEQRDMDKEITKKKFGAAVAYTSTAGAGMVGGLIGTAILPGIGTAVGGGLGFYIGNFAGTFGGTFLGSKVYKLFSSK